MNYEIVASVVLGPAAFGRAIPVLVGLAVHEAPGVEPSGGVRIVGLGILHLTHRTYCDVVAFGGNERYFSPQVFRNWRRLGDRRKVLHHAIASRLHVRIVLQVLGRQPFIGLVPMIRFEQIFLDMIRGLFVAVELLVFAVEERVDIGGGNHGFLRVHGRRDQHRGEQGSQSELNFHGYYVCSSDGSLSMLTMAATPRGRSSTLWILHSF